MWEFCETVTYRRPVVLTVKKEAVSIEWVTYQLSIKLAHSTAGKLLNRERRDKQGETRPTGYSIKRQNQKC